MKRNGMRKIFRTIPLKGQAIISNNASKHSGLAAPYFHPHNFVDRGNLSEMEVNSTDETSIFFLLIENFIGIQIHIQYRVYKKRCQFVLYLNKIGATMNSKSI